jgi:exonuclease 3'-5' domain-containing protein 1
MYIDLEGPNLCRHGSISIFTLLVDTGVSTGRVYLIDVQKLGAEAFGTPGTEGKTLRDILQNEQTPKVFFDVRNDSDALYAHFDVALQGIEDVQLMESATRKTTQSRRLLNSLKTCVENNVFTSIDSNRQTSWELAKDNGGRLFKVEHGGFYEILNERSIPEILIAYCVGDTFLSYGIGFERSKPFDGESW